MRIAFYAPLKPPDHPVTSGDRTVARSLIAALRHAGHEVDLASHFRSYDGGDSDRQKRLADEGGKLAERYLRRIGESVARPDLWFTYHLYHKAPDWIGPAVTKRLGIPYVVAEASYAPKQAGGAWDLGHRAVADALREAALVLEPNPADAECVQPLLSSPEKLALLPPFLDTAPFRAPSRGVSRTEIERTLDLDATKPWLLTVAMMREDQKLQSYRVLADAMARLTDKPWELIIAGAGEAEPAVRDAFAPLAERLRWAGVLQPERLRALYRAADLYLWPAVKEAYGMAFLEAQAAGLPVVAGRSGGVPGVVAEGSTGLLAAEGDAAAFADAVAVLLADPVRRQAMGEAAMSRALREHDISVAAKRLDDHLRRLVVT